ncbi:MAG: DUF58 domain-containing protein [Oscillospiraceae bacterium]|jgi:hypothetical protein|nr:DUF58 domain-containing protein [Oscillospiraceae bacterium]
MMITLIISLIALGLILEIISLRRDPSKLKYNIDLSTACTEPGVPFTVHSIISNTSRIPVSYLEITEIYPSLSQIPENVEVEKGKRAELLIKKTCRIRAFKRKKIALDVLINKRGIFTFIGDSFKLGDFLGFRVQYLTLMHSRELVVYPEKRDYPEITEALGRFFGEVSAKRYLIRDPILTVGIREYTGREPKKEIHWLQSARRAELMVRELDHNRQLSACVIMATEEINFTEEEKLDEICAVARNVCETLIKTGVAVIFYTNAMVMRSVRKNTCWRCEVSTGRTGELLEGLGRTVGYAVASLESLLNYACRENNQDTAFIVILPEDGTRGEEAVQRLRHKTGRDALIISA